MRIKLFVRWLSVRLDRSIDHDRQTDRQIDSVKRLKNYLHPPPRPSILLYNITHISRAKNSFTSIYVFTSVCRCLKTAQFVYKRLYSLQLPVIGYLILAIHRSTVQLVPAENSNNSPTRQGTPCLVSCLTCYSDTPDQGPRAV